MTLAGKELISQITYKNMCLGASCGLLRMQLDLIRSFYTPVIQRLNFQTSYQNAYLHLVFELQGGGEWGCVRAKVFPWIY